MAQTDLNIAQIAPSETTCDTPWDPETPLYRWTGVLGTRGVGGQSSQSGQTWLNTAKYVDSAKVLLIFVVFWRNLGLLTPPGLQASLDPLASQGPK